MNIKKVLLSGLVLLMTSSCSSLSKIEQKVKTNLEKENIVLENTIIEEKKEDIVIEQEIENGSVDSVVESISKNPNKNNAVKNEVVDVDKGYLIVDIPKKIYSNYPAKEIVYSFSNEEYASEVTYMVSDSRLKIEDHKMYATGTFDTPIDVIVKVLSENCEPVIRKVNVSTYNPVSNFETRMKFYEENLIKEENKGGTIFVGDSYFDGYPKSKPPFWSDFYTDYQNEDKIFLMGASSSQIEQLEVSAERIVYPMEPKEIIMHIGFNDVHSGHLPVQDIYARIIALVEQYRENLPNVKVYFIGVEPKKNGYTLGTANYNSSTIRATALTEKIKEYAKNSSWFTYVDTLDIFVGSDGVIKTNSYLSTDNSHPTLQAYDLIRERINSARVAGK